ncbi:MAG: methylenetetrahydrofolate reductase C-terminal domain-containing protein [Oscillospiraceae bacterium]|nr:methylenetetrahydrofolate reductase C-terminal domain-containing protein [Oscillospiraceae bacterium]
MRSVEPFKNVVVAGCGVCVTVCMSGGEKEAMQITNLLKLSAKENNRDMTVTTTTPFRQCDTEFLDECENQLKDADCILSMACGAGVQFMAEKFPDKVVLPGLNTLFIGVNRDLGYWTEMCQGCGSCVLEKTGGVCPVARCSKSHFNGPCGGSGDGKCEIDKETECGWQLIYERMKRLDRLDKLTELEDVRDWSTSRDGGPRHVRRDDVTVT